VRVMSKGSERADRTGSGAITRIRWGGSASSDVLGDAPAARDVLLADAAEL